MGNIKEMECELHTFNEIFNQQCVVHRSTILMQLQTTLAWPMHISVINITANKKRLLSDGNDKV